MSTATMPTKIAAISSIASMNWSMCLRCTGPPYSMERRRPTGRHRRRASFRGGVAFCELGGELLHHRVGVRSRLAHAVGPGVVQRLGRFLPGRDLLGAERIDLVAGL